MHVAILPGDGIGPEVTAQAERVLAAAAERSGIPLFTSHHAIGAAGVQDKGDPFPHETRDAVARADAVLLGAVGDPSLDSAPRHLKPETGLLALRALLGVYANLRPVAIYPALAVHSPLKPERLAGTDLLIVRELTGGLYYGEPRGLDGEKAINTLRYTRSEIERIARLAFDAARLRRRQVLSVDKANVLETSQLWRRVVTEVSHDYADVALEHAYVDFAAMRLVSAPSSIDVLVTENMFGDILSDEAAVLTGSLGMLPSASLGDGVGLYEPIHGSAPDIAGQGISNPIGAILSCALLLRHSGGAHEAAGSIETAVSRVLEGGARTRDIAAKGRKPLSTRQMGDRILEELEVAETPAR